MKRFILIITLLLGITTNTLAQDKGTLGSVLSGLVGGAISNAVPLTADRLIGTWNYQSVACSFKTNNLLLKAGGEAAAQTIEKDIDQQLRRVGIKPGSCSFTFAKDNACTVVIGGRKLSGKYELNTKEKTVQMTFMRGLTTSTARLELLGDKLTLLFDADKLLRLVTTVAALSQNGTIQTLNTIAKKYDGMYIGLETKK